MFITRGSFGLTGAEADPSLRPRAHVSQAGAAPQKNGAAGRKCLPAAPFGVPRPQAAAG